MARNKTAERRQTVGIWDLYVRTDFVNRHTTAKWSANETSIKRKEVPF